MNPALVDFNIHPAKKEVRFKDSSELHHGVSSTVRNFFRAYGIKASQDFSDDDTQDLSRLARIQDSYARVQDSYVRVQEQFEQRHTADKLVAEPSARRIEPQENLSRPLSKSETQKSLFRSETEPEAQKKSDFRARFFDYDRAPAIEKSFGFNHTSRLAEAALSVGILQSQDSPETSATSVEAERSQSSFAPEKTDSDGIKYIGTRSAHLFWWKKTIRCTLSTSTRRTSEFCSTSCLHMAGKNSRFLCRTRSPHRHQKKIFI